MNAAPYSKIGDRLRVEQRTLECFNGTDVRLACARAHFRADTRTRNVSPRLRDDLAILDPTIDDAADQDIEWFPGVGASHEICRQATVDIEIVARRTLELRANLSEHGRDRLCRPNFDLGGICDNRWSKNERQCHDCCRN